MQIEWLSDASFRVGGQVFELSTDYSPESQLQPLRLLRDKAQLATIERVHQAINFKTVFEVGFFDGGSTLYYLERYGVDKVVATDIRGQALALDAALADARYGERLVVGYSVSQNDEAALARMATHFEGQPIDLIVDDASHIFEFSLATFEVLFPRLRPGGVYMLEDWGWAHHQGTQPGGQHYEHMKPYASLANLSIMIQLAMVSNPQLIESIEITASAAVIRKGEAAASDARLDLKSLCLSRGNDILLL
jgi:Methyltransferase domain